MEDIGTKKIVTERLILRRFSHSDLNSMYDNWAKDPDVIKYLSWEEDMEKNELKKVLDIWINKYKEKDFYQWCISHKEDKNKSIGTIYIENETAMEIGYCISKDYWNRGYMTEALIEVIDYMFRCVGINHLIAKHHIENKASGRVMRKVGMTKDGKMLEYMDKLGSYKVIMYSMSRDMWLENPIYKNKVNFFYN